TLAMKIVTEQADKLLEMATVNIRLHQESDDLGSQYCGLHLDSCGMANLGHSGWRRSQGVRHEPGHLLGGNQDRERPAPAAEIYQTRPRSVGGCYKRSECLYSVRFVETELN